MPKFSKGEIFKSPYGDVEIISDNGASDVDFKFLSTGYISNASRYRIQHGHIKDRLVPSIYGKAYLGGTKYNSVNSKPAMRAWRAMLYRVFKAPTNYSNCSVVDEWLNFQEFAAWYMPKYFEGCSLDKDGIKPGNRTYGPNLCQLISKGANMKLAKCRTILIMDPEKNIHEVFNQKEFAKQHGLDHSCLNAVLNNKRKTHKGWRLVPF